MHTHKSVLELWDPGNQKPEALKKELESPKIWTPTVNILSTISAYVHRWMAIILL
jgi:hypothetical protein